VVIADAPLDVLPLYARAGAVLPKIPEDVMTLVPAAESGNTALKTLDNRRVYELLPNATGSQSATVTDFEGRTLSRTGNALEINGKAARVILRWRFDPVNSVTLGGAPLELHNDASGRYVEFDHTGRSTMNWK
jgi:alpha-D-xyloside xylohydrolase